MSRPEKKFRCGPISASIWAEDKTVESGVIKFHSVNITKAYKDGDEWKHTNSFNTEDLPKVALVVNEAYKYIRLSSSNPQTEPCQ